MAARVGSTSTAVTHGVKVTVQSRYVPEQSQPRTHQYVYAYHVRIENHGPDTVQLRTRHWIITDGNGVVREVEGPGVVGEQPTLQTGQAFEYTSGSSLPTQRGTMRGTYRMHRDDGSSFDAEIPMFVLELPYSLN
jgi:ApaG protein